MQRPDLSRAVSRDLGYTFGYSLDTPIPGKDQSALQSVPCLHPVAIPEAEASGLSPP